MKRVCRVNKDYAGGIIEGGGNTHVKVNGFYVAVDGDKVRPHGNSEHSNSKLIANSKVRINGKMICVEDNYSTCGHTATSTSNVKIG